MSARETPDPEDPLKWVIENHFSKKTQGTERNARLSLFGTVGSNGQGARVALKPWLEQKDVPPEKLTFDLAYEYVNDLRDAYAPRTQRLRANIASKSYEIFLRRNVEGFDCNPINEVIEEHPRLLQNVTKNSTTIYDKEVIKQVIGNQHPVHGTVSMTMLKTARRIGGVLNLDCRDVHLEHPAADWTVHQEIRNKPNHIHFGPGVSAGEVFRGETRQDGMKTETRVTIPIDEELKSFLIWYLSFRRSSEHEGAFFINPGVVQEDQRLCAQSYRDVLIPVIKEQGLYYKDHDPDNIRPHYFRHWTTSKMRDRISDGTVDYFRGDKKAISDTYNHYTEEKANLWKRNIPKLYRPYKTKADQP